MKHFLISVIIILSIHEVAMAQEIAIAQDNSTFMYGLNTKLGISMWINSGNNFSNLPVDRVEYLSGIAGKYWLSSVASCSVALGGALSFTTQLNYSALVAYAQYEHHIFLQNSPISPYAAFSIGTNLSRVTYSSTNVTALKILGFIGAEYKIFPNLSASIQSGLGIYYGFGSQLSVPNSFAEIALGLGSTSFILTMYLF
jgi:hypothetical protein